MEIDAIDDALASAARQGRSLVIEGPAGLGKSSLLAHSRSQAASRGIRVLVGRGEELERDYPFGVATQLYGAVIAKADAEDPGLLAGAPGLAGGVLAQPGDARGGAGESIFPVLHGLHWLTSNLAERGPLLIAIDDLQWADEPSLRLLLYLLDRLEELPVALIAAIRIGEPQPEELARILDRVALRAHRSLTLAPLSGEAVAETVRELTEAADDELCAVVAELTAGNPLLIRELLASVDVGQLDPARAAAAQLAATVPEQTARSLGVRLGRLGNDAERLATAVAILEPDALLGRAARLAELDSGRAAAAVDLLERADIVATGEPLRFTHPLLRSAVRSRLSGAEERRSHLVAARILAADGAASEKVAAHLVSGEICREPWAIAALREAASAASARGSPQSAVTFLRRAVEACGDRSARGELLIELATAETAAGDARAADRFEEAFAVVGEPRRRAEVLCAQGEARWVRSDYGGAVDSFARGLAEVGAADEQLEARLVAGVGAASALAPDRAEFAAAAIGERLGRLLAAPPERPTLPERVLLAYAAGQSAASVLADRGTVLDLARRALGEGDPLAELGRVVIEPAAAALVLGEALDDALALYTAMLDDARERGALPTVAGLLPQRGLCLLRLGKVDEALTDGEDAIRLGAELPGANLAEPTGRAILAVAQLERGDEAAAWEAVDLDLADAERRWGFLPVYGVYLTGRGRVELQRGRLREALALLREGFERMAAAGYVNPNYFESGSEIALVAHPLGEEDAARELIRSDTELAERFGAPRALAMARRALGLIEGGERGLELLHDAVALLRTSPARLDRARTLVDLGSALRRAGNRGDARERLEEGMDLGHACGATALADRAAGELRTLGLRPRRSALSGADALTPSELRTARMAAAGMSNREIAQKLFLTLRTIESHLTGAYRKLGISSRRQLPDAFAGRDADPTR